MTEHVAVAVVGGGPAGLSAAAVLAGRVDGPVVVLDRERETGGIPRHSDHTGYGLRDLHRLLTGPAYARRLTARAADAGAQLRTSAMVTGWTPDGALEVTAPTGRTTLRADAVVLATGARERPRPARLVPGDRPDGVLTTGTLQNLVHLHHRRDVGRCAVVVGAELVSWSAVLTLRDAGCSTALLVSAHAVPEAVAPVRFAARVGLRVPVATRTRLVAVEGRDRVEAVVLEHLDSGARRRVGCDTVVLTGDWVPDHELARLGGLVVDRGTKGPAVDGALRTTRRGVFAAGNLLHPVDTADVAALDGLHVADAVVRHLADPAAWPASPDRAGLRLRVEPPLRWVAPQVLHPGEPPARGRLLLWCDATVPRPVVEAVRDGAVVARRRLPWAAAPGRVFRVPSSLLDAVPRDGEVTVRLA
jgi:thioredoxin reductase